MPSVELKPVLLSLALRKIFSFSVDLPRPNMAHHPMPVPVRELAGGAGSVNVVRFTKDGNYCLTGGDDRVVRLWNPHKDDPAATSITNTNAAGPKNALLIKKYEGMHGYSILDVAVSHDNARFASSGVDKSVFLWDVTSGRVVRRIQHHTQKVNALEMNDDSTVLLTASYDQTVCIWDLRSNMRDPIQTLADFKDSVTSLARTQCSILAGSVDGCLRTYDLRKGLLHTDSFPGECITCVRTTHDKNCAVSMCMALSDAHLGRAAVLPGSGMGAKVRLSDIATGRLVKSYSGHRHNSYKSECCVANDDVHIVAGSEDGSIHFWHIITTLQDAQKTIFGAHTSGVSALSHHPTKPLLLSAGYDGKTKLWDV